MFTLLFRKQSTLIDTVIHHIKFRSLAGVGLCAWAEFREPGEQKRLGTCMSYRGCFVLCRWAASVVGLPDGLRVDEHVSDLKYVHPTWNEGRQATRQPQNCCRYILYGSANIGSILTDHYRLGKIRDFPGMHSQFHLPWWGCGHYIRCGPELEGCVCTPKCSSQCRRVWRIMD